MSLDTERRLQALEKRLERLEASGTGYETGTWTPVLVGVGTAGTFTYSTQTGNYTRIGNRVFFNARITISAITGAPAGLMTITGLPYTSYATGAGGTMGRCSFMLQTAWNYAAGYTQVEGVIVASESRIQIYKNGDGVAVTSVTGAETVGIPAGTIDLLFAGEYQV